jgi:hypothetical protein
MSAATATAAWAAAVRRPGEIQIEDARGFGDHVAMRLRRALNHGAAFRPDPRHPQLFFIEWDHDWFYVAPLPSGKILLLAHNRG